MAIIVWTLIGLIAGWLTHRLMEGSGVGIVRDLLAAAIGSIFSGVVAGLLLDLQNFILKADFATIVVATLGAVAAVALLNSESFSGGYTNG